MKKLLTAMIGVFFLGLGLAAAKDTVKETVTTHTVTMSGVT
jgi:hypothetical protein